MSTLLTGTRVSVSRMHRLTSLGPPPYLMMHTTIYTQPCSYSDDEVAQIELAKMTAHGMQVHTSSAVQPKRAREPLTRPCQR